MTLLMNLGAAVSAVIQPISLPTLAQSASTYTVGNLTVQLDLGDGSYTVAHKGITIFRKAYAAVMLDSLLSSSDYEAHSVNTAPLHDAAGNGLKITVLHTGPALPTCGRIFCFMRGGITCSPSHLMRRGRRNGKNQLYFPPLDFTKGQCAGRRPTLVAFFGGAV